MKRALLVAAIGAVVYTNALGGSFHFDDGHAVVDNPSIRSLANLGRFFTDPRTFTVLPQNENYRPLLLVTYALTARFFGVSAPAFIAVNLIIHLLCALLVLHLAGALRRLIDPQATGEIVALLAAAIFAVHPLFSECVNYVHARSESLSSLLALASLAAYLRARATDRARWLALAGVALFAALSSKVIAGMLPFAVVAIELAAADRHPPRKVGQRLLALAIPLAAFSLLYVHFTTPLSVASRSSFGRLQYLRSELPAVLHYVRLFVWPFGQSADPGYPVAESFLLPGVLAAGLVIGCAIAFAAWGLVLQRWTGAALAATWFLLFLAPTSTVFPLGEIVNEHRPYLAAAALCALAAEGLVRISSELPQLRVGVPVLLVAALGVLTVERNRVWRNEEALWRDVVDKTPESSRAHLNYGLALQGAGRLAEAESHLREAVRLAPNYAYAQMGLGAFLLTHGDEQAAIASLDRAIELDRELYYAYYLRGVAGEGIGDPPLERAAYFARAATLSPNHADTLFHLSTSRDQGGDLAGALSAAQRLVAVRGNFDDRLQLAYLMLKKGDVAGAQPILLELRSERPGDPRVEQDLAFAARSATGSSRPTR